MNYKKLLSISLICLLFMVMVSNVILMTHRHKDGCIHEDCPLCAFIQRHHDDLKLLGTGNNSILSILFLLACHLTVSFYENYISKFKFTLVGLRVRLNN